VVRHCPWSVEEKQYLHQYVISNVKQDKETDTMYWSCEWQISWER